jgi:hypothetical protein
MDHEEVEQFKRGFRSPFYFFSWFIEITCASSMS